MNNFFWFSSIRKTTIEFLNIFRNIRVAKYDEKGDFSSYVSLPIKNANKEKFYYWLSDRRHEKRFPMLAISMTGLYLDQNRLANKQYETFFSRKKPDGTQEIKNYYNISPWNITYNVEIVSLFQIEMDQILEQILGFFDPNNFVKIDIPEIDNVLNIKVLLKNASKNDNQSEMNDYRHISWSLSFEAQTYLFKPLKNVGIIKEVDEYFFTSLPPSAEYELLITDKNGTRYDGTK